MSSGIVRKTSGRLARKEKALWDALAEFANLRGSRLLSIQAEDVRQFRLKHPRFFPSDCYDVAEGRAVWPGLAEGVGTSCFRAYRRWLRDLWRGKGRTLEDPRLLDILLGLEPDHLSCLPGGRESWLPRANATADWRTGTLNYEPSCDFQKALHELCREKWRAKVCGRCNKLFVADGPAQVYCGAECVAETERLRKLAWWHRFGNDWRAARAARQRRPGGGKRVLTKSHRKRGG